jgi:hypothetical protein
MKFFFDIFKAFDKVLRSRFIPVRLYLGMVSKKREGKNNDNRMFSNTEGPYKQNLIAFNKNI